MATHKLLYLTPEVHKAVNDLASRDARPPWLIVKDALSYYRHLHKDPRDPPALPARRRGRPHKPKG